MSNIDIFSMAIRNLFKRKLRTFLTVLGVVVGAIAIIIMISIGVGVNLSFEKQIKNIQDATIIEIYNHSGYSGTTMGATILDDAKLAEIMKIDGVDVVTPYESMYLYARSGRYIAEFQVIGMDMSVIDKFGYQIIEGEYLSKDDPYGVLFGSDVAYEFKTEKERNRYNWQGLVGSTERKMNVNVLKDRIKASPDWNFIQPQDTSGSTDGEYYYDEQETELDDQQNSVQPFRAFNIYGVGILDGSTKYDAARNCIMNIETVMQIQQEYTAWQNKAYGSSGRTQETNGYRTAYVKCETIDDVSYVTERLNEYNFDYVWNRIEFIDNLRGMMDTLQVMLSTIGAVSLFVAAIGIANTMITSIYERTKEIGVMKVIGASVRDIKKLFLVEASLIGLIGGMLGVGLSYIVSYIVNNMNISLFSDIMYGMGTDDKLSVIPLWLSLLSLGFSAVIGLISGYLPARRATRISALTAIRTD